MNIFFLHNEPALAAQAHCDKHVVKMILESAQLLSGVWHYFNQVPEGVLPSDFPDSKNPDHISKLLAPTHLNHPCAIWARASAENYHWLSDLAYCLCREYTHRYGKQHALDLLIRKLCRHNPTKLAYTFAGITSPALAMPSSTKVFAESLYPADLSTSRLLADIDSPLAPWIYAYRIYYLSSKADMLTYTKRKPPLWAHKLATWKAV